MRFIYIAGPYTAPTAEGIERNVWAAIEAGHRLMDLGFHPFVPHLSHYSEARRPRHYEEWMALDFAWIRKCDAMLRLPGASSGADREVALARELGIPVFEAIESIAVSRSGGEGGKGT